MFRPRIIPVLLLKNKGLVKTINFKNERYIGDPINAVKIFNELLADELIILDIDASLNNSVISPEIVRKIGYEAFMPFAVGGGIKTVDQIKALINSGAEKVVLNSEAILRPEFIKDASDIFGSQSIIVSIDIKKNIFNRYIVYIKSGTKKISKTLDEILNDSEKYGAGEIFLNSIDYDGMMNGYDLYLLKYVSERINIPVIASGGAGSYSDFYKAFKNSGASAVAAGSLFVFQGPRKAVLINYPSFKERKLIFYGE